MKRVVCCIAAISLLFLLTACGSAKPLDTSYEGEIRVTDDEREYAAYLVSSEDGLRVTLSAPESVAGLCFDYRGEELHTTLDGLDCVTDADSLPPASFVSLLHEVFESADQAEYVGSEDGVDTFTLKTSGGSAEISLKNGKPQTVTADYGNWTINFS